MNNKTDKKCNALICCIYAFALFSSLLNVTHLALSVRMWEDTLCLFLWLKDWWLSLEEHVYLYMSMFEEKRSTEGLDQALE